MTLPVTRVEWKPCWRIIPSRFPPIQLFERVTNPNDLEVIFELEALTNPKIRNDVGNIELVPHKDRISGPGSSVIMAAFTHLNPNGGRFLDSTYCAFNSANDLNTAVAETRYHCERFMIATALGHMELDMRVYLADLDGDLHDLRGQKTGQMAVYHNDNYSVGQNLARTLREDGSNGIVYDSVRRSGGECAAVFRPLLLSKVRQEMHLCYIWNGQKITMIYEKRELGNNGVYLVDSAR